MGERGAGRQEQDLLKHFGMVSEEQLAVLLGVSRKTLQNRPIDKLPEFVKQGRRRLFPEAAVREFLRPRSAR